MEAEQNKHVNQARAGLERRHGHLRCVEQTIVWLSAHSFLDPCLIVCT
jgi:hypothetical protein